MGLIGLMGLEAPPSQQRLLALLLERAELLRLEPPAAVDGRTRLPGEDNSPNCWLDTLDGARRERW